MDVMSSSFAVISLAIQLLETTQKIRSFLHDVRDAPKEIIRLTELLDQLHGTLDNVKSLLEQQYLVLRLPGSPVHMIRALENCEKTMQQLESVVKKAKESFGHQQCVKRTWASMRFASTRETIRELQDQLRDAKADLQGAISSNTWQLQYRTSSFDKVELTNIAQDAYSPSH
jgi:ABC-type transporter Mla subunit MlaD